MVKSKATMAAMDLFLKGSIALAEVESHGIRIDTDYLDRAIDKAAVKAKALEERLKADKVFDVWRRVYGAKATLGSPEQLGRILFEKMGYECTEFTDKEKRPKVTQKTLAGVDLPFVRRWQRLEEWKDVKACLQGIRRETVGGFLHPFFHLTGSGEDGKGGAISYRGSSSAPNFQNMPARTPWMAEFIRRTFIPRPGRRLVENDFSAHEFRIAAAVWKDPLMCKYAADPKLDIHRDMAMEMFMIPKEEASEKKIRYMGKNGFVFPHLYGSAYQNIASRVWVEMDGAALSSGMPLKKWLRKKGVENLGACDFDRDAVPGTFEHHMKGVEDGFDRRFPVFARAKDEWYNTYRENGGFPLLTGFWVEGVYSKNQCLNTPIQGPAFHCLLWCLIRLMKKIRRAKMKALVVGQIHDCTVGDVPDSEVQDYLGMMKEIVEVDLPRAWDWLIVPLGIEAEVTPTFEEGGTWWAKSQWVQDKRGVWAPKEAA